MSNNVYFLEYTLHSSIGQMLLSFGEMSVYRIYPSNFYLQYEKNCKSICK